MTPWLWALSATWWVSIHPSGPDTGQQWNQCEGKLQVSWRVHHRGTLHLLRPRRLISIPTSCGDLNLESSSSIEWYQGASWAQISPRLVWELANHNTLQQTARTAGLMACLPYLNKHQHCGSPRSTHQQFLPRDYQITGTLALLNKHLWTLYSSTEHVSLTPQLDILLF